VRASKFQVRTVGSKFVHVLSHGPKEGGDTLSRNLTMIGGCQVKVDSHWEEGWEVKAMSLFGNTKHGSDWTKSGNGIALPIGDGLEIVLILLATMEDCAIPHLIDRKIGYI
jgi:hypothetical protein